MSSPEPEPTLAKQITFKLDSANEDRPKTRPTIRVPRENSFTPQFDDKSPEPRSIQFQRQLTTLTCNRNNTYRGLVSTDQFRDMIEIEKEYGSILEKGPPKSTTYKHWQLIYDYLHYGESRLSKLKMLIEKAHIASFDREQIEKKRNLEAFLHQKTKQRE